MPGGGWFGLDTVAWLDIGIGVLTGAGSLVSRRPRPALSGSLVFLLTGITLLGAAAKNGAVQWTGLAAASAVMAWTTVRWLRQRRASRAACSR
jgi:hypothetical protein